jgi:hypothetical protein
MGVSRFYPFTGGDRSFPSGAGSCSLRKSCSKPKSFPVLTKPNALDWRKPPLTFGSSPEIGSHDMARPLMAPDIDRNQHAWG